MDFLTCFNNAGFFNISIFLLASYLLASHTFGTYLGSNYNIAYPNLINCFNFFSCFFLFSVLNMFCFDFVAYDTLYFFNQNFVAVFLMVSIMVLLISRDFLDTQKIVKFEYDSLFLFVVFSSICLCFSDDLLIIYLAIEIQSLAFYIFASFNRVSEFTTEAGLKYFIFGSIISCFLLLGFSLVYLTFGATSFELMFSIASIKNDPFIFLGILFILIGFLFKVGAVPFHWWLCDVYDGSILPVTLLFAAMPKIIFFSIFIKLYFFIFVDFFGIWSNILLFASLGSIIVGSFFALYQKRIKRLFAYSTIAHTGFILLGILASSPTSAKALIFYVLSYAILTLFIFALMIYSTISANRSIMYLSNWTSFGFKNYFFAFCFVLALFSIAGIPPLLGFFNKFFVLLSFIGQEYYVASVVVILASSVGCFYYIRFIKIFFFTKTAKYSLWISNTTKQNAEIIISSCLFINICFFTRPEFLSNISTIIGFALF